MTEELKNRPPMPVPEDDETTSWAVPPQPRCRVAETESDLMKLVRGYPMQDNETPKQYAERMRKMLDAQMFDASPNKPVVRNYRPQTKIPYNGIINSKICQTLNEWGSVLGDVCMGICIANTPAFMAALGLSALMGGSVIFSSVVLVMQIGFYLAKPLYKHAVNKRDEYLETQKDNLALVHKTPSLDEKELRHLLLETDFNPSGYEGMATPLHHVVKGEGSGLLLDAFRAWCAGSEAMQEDMLNKLDILLTCGANPNVKDKEGLTPLDYAVERKDMAAVQKLLDAGADVGMQDKNGNTVVFRAKNNEMVQLLCQYGARLDQQNKKGMTARQIVNLFSETPETKDKDDTVQQNVDRLDMPSQLPVQKKGMRRKPAAPRKKRQGPTLDLDKK